MLPQTDITRIVAIINAMPDLAGAYLHGSALTPCFHPRSDIDIALLFFPGVQPDLVNIIVAYHGPIEMSVGHAPHFSILSSKNVVFAHQVLTKGKRIICHAPFVCQSFAMHIFSMYIELNFERKQVLDVYTAG